MRVSEYFNLGLTQPYLDFVDVDVEKDVRYYIDPTALLIPGDAWSSECVSAIQDFFQRVVSHLAAGRHDAAARLMAYLSEPNETHLGQSQGSRSRGRGLGEYRAYDVVDALEESGAIGTGLLQDLEDTILMIRGIGLDMISDITTNIIRSQLIAYTQEVAAVYGIPTTPHVNSGYLWNSQQGIWTNRYVSLPMGPAGKLLLTPKAIVRRELTYNYNDYFNNYILPFLEDREIAAGSGLVRVLKSGPRKGQAIVTKKDLREKYGDSKTVVVDLTKQNPALLEQYRAARRQRPKPPLIHSEFDGAEGENTVPWSELLEQTVSVPRGSNDASLYHDRITKLLTVLFYPALVFPHKEEKIHQGRKRIDIAFTNAATHGFFQWVAQHHAAANVFVECKNYSSDLANPELDQLSGRFSPSRGQVGLLLCRHLEDKELFIQRCRDTALDGRGFIIPLDDDDLAALVQIGDDRDEQFASLKARFDQLVN
jgi:hypothetical protein